SGAAALIGFAISDVPGDRLDTIASGPTVADPTRFADALAALGRAGIAERVPPAVRAHLEAGARGEVPGAAEAGRAGVSRRAGSRCSRARPTARTGRPTPRARSSTARARRRRASAARTSPGR